MLSPASKRDLPARSCRARGRGSQAGRCGSGAAARSVIPSPPGRLRSPPRRLRSPPGRALQPGRLAMDLDAIILGAGPAGSTTALLLARAGWSVAIVEKDAFPRRKVCGEFMSATNAPLLALLGVDDVVRERAGPEISRVGLYSGSECMEAAMPSFSDRSAPWGRALGRDLLDTALLARAVAAGAFSWQP